MIYARVRVMNAMKYSRTYLHHKEEASSQSEISAFIEKITIY